MILVTGAAGQLGSDVISELKERGIEHLGVDVADFDITDSDKTREFLSQTAPSCVIHCAAYTAVDAAEDDARRCTLVNVSGVENLAAVCGETDTEMIYLSTDYVFDGKCGAPYETDAPKAPLSVYGRSKLAGEDAVIRHLSKFYIVRTSWMFGQNGNNFVKTILRLSQNLREINVVCDQVGSPTYTPDLAVLLADMSLSGKYGVYHATNEGFCSWADFAQEIIHLCGAACKVNHIPTEEYPTRAIRPKNSKLSKTSLDRAGFTRLPKWENALNRYVRNS